MVSLGSGSVATSIANHFWREGRLPGQLLTICTASAEVDLDRPASAGGGQASKIPKELTLISILTHGWF